MSGIPSIFRGGEDKGEHTIFFLVNWYQQLYNHVLLVEDHIQETIQLHPCKVRQ